MESLQELGAGPDWPENNARLGAYLKRWFTFGRFCRHYETPREYQRKHDGRYVHLFASFHAVRVASTAAELSTLRRSLQQRADSGLPLATYFGRIRLLRRKVRHCRTGQV